MLSKPRMGQYAKAYAYEIHVSKSWNRREEKFEDVFDSYTMDFNTFKASLDARLSEINDNDEGYTYYLGSDDKRYYQTTNAQKLEGCETATISVTCHDGAKLGEGSTQYKCSTCGGSVNQHTKECVMATTVVETPINTTDIDTQINDMQTSIALIQNQITELENENTKLLRDS